MAFNEGTFYKIIQDTWASTLGFQVERAESMALPVVDAFIVRVGISGAWDGEVCLRCSPPLARLIAAVTFRVESEKAENEEILDALSELTHIIGGNLKALLPQPVILSFPAHLDPEKWARTTAQRQTVCQLTLQSEGKPFAVSLFQRKSCPHQRE